MNFDETNSFSISIFVLQVYRVPWRKRTHLYNIAQWCDETSFYHVLNSKFSLSFKVDSTPKEDISKWASQALEIIIALNAWKKKKKKPSNTFSLAAGSQPKVTEKRKFILGLCYNRNINTFN